MELEEKILSGVFFSTSPSRSPARTPDHSRSPSPDPLFPSNDDLSGSDVEDDPLASQNIPTEDNPNGTLIRGGRTGVKGVIQDANEVARRNQERKVQDIKEVNRRMENMALTARTYAEEEEERLREKAKEEGLSEAEFTRKRMFEKTGRFGHLREVGVGGFIEAIDSEDPKTWVVIHIYDPSLDRCHIIDATLARLARQHPQIKFLRARAGAIGFASSTVSELPDLSSSHRNGNLIAISENDSYSDDGDLYTYDEDEESEDNQNTVTDTDMLPTLLVYQSGQLVHNWIRVDWEAEAWAKRKEGSLGSSSLIEAFLRSYNIIKKEKSGNCGFSSDDERELEIVSGDQIDEDEIFDL